MIKYPTPVVASIRDKKWEKINCYVNLSKCFILLNFDNNNTNFGNILERRQTDSDNWKKFHVRKNKTEENCVVNIVHSFNLNTTKT